MHNRGPMLVLFFFAFFASYGIAQTAPVLESINAIDGTTRITLTFDKELVPVAPGHNMFGVSVNDGPYCYRSGIANRTNVIGSQATGKKVHITIGNDNSIGILDRVTVEYDPGDVPSVSGCTGRAGSKITGTNGVQVAKFGPTGVDFIKRPPPPPPPTPPPDDGDDEEEEESENPDPPNPTPPNPTPPGGGGGGGSRPTPPSEDDDSGPSRPVSRCSEPEEGTRVWRWIKDSDNEAILQLEASTLGRDAEQEINPVVTLFSRDVLGDRTPSISSGYRFQVERVGRRDWVHTIDGEQFFVNHLRTAATYGDYGLTKASRTITVDGRRFQLQRPVSRTILTGCDWRPVYRRECEAGTLVWRWIRSEDGEVVLQLEASSRGTDDEQTVRTTVTLFTPDVLPEDYDPVVRQGRNNPRLEVIRFSQGEAPVEIEGKEYYVYHIDLGEGRPAPLSSRRNSIVDATGQIMVGDWEFKLQRDLGRSSVVTGCHNGEDR